MAIRPRSYEIRALRRRHNLTQEQLAASLYGIKVESVVNWERDRRNCKPIVWWAMVLTWDKIDLWSHEDEWVKKFRLKPGGA